MPGELSEGDLSRVFEQHYPLVYRRALRLLGSASDAEDAAQEIFIRAFRAASTFDGRNPVSTWLYAIATNHCLTRLRDRARRVELDEAWKPDDPASLLQPARMILLRHLLSLADDALAQAAICVYIEGMSHAEAAEVLGVSRRTVGNHIDSFIAFARAHAASSAQLPAKGLAALPRRGSS